jgi:uncharacterized protein
MMAKLINQTQNCEIIGDLKVADSFWLRLVGLLGRKQMSPNEGMWFDHCNSIHTFGMRFSLDVIFLDSAMKIKALRPNVVPGRMTWPVLGARSAVEVASGGIERMKVKIGDQLYVGH